MFPLELVQDSARLLDQLRGLGLRIATAESCTGGLIAALLTEVPGSSHVVERGFVTYSNAAKTELLGVDAALVARVGAVSRETALAMVAGALARAPVEVAVAVTGVAGPGGGSVDKPVGLVHVAAQRKGAPAVHRECRFGAIGRSEIRAETVRAAFAVVRQAAGLTA